MVIRNIVKVPPSWRHLLWEIHCYEQIVIFLEGQYEIFFEFPFKRMFWYFCNSSYGTEYSSLQLNKKPTKQTKKPTNPPPNYFTHKISLLLKSLKVSGHKFIFLKWGTFGLIKAAAFLAWEILFYQMKNVGMRL